MVHRQGISSRSMVIRDSREDNIMEGHRSSRWAVEVRMGGLHRHNLLRRRQGKRRRTVWGFCFTSKRCTTTMRPLTRSSTSKQAISSRSRRHQRMAGGAASCSTRRGGREGGTCSRATSCACWSDRAPVCRCPRRRARLPWPLVGTDGPAQPVVVLVCYLLAFLIIRSVFAANVLAVYTCMDVFTSLM